MSVHRWVITDPSITDVSDPEHSYTFPRNPVSMSSPYAELAISSTTSTRGAVMLWQGPTQPKQWTFTGPILDRQHLIDLHRWVLNKQRRLILTDHFGRKLSLVFTGLDLVPKPRVNVYYSHDYTASALVYRRTATTIDDNGNVA